MEHFKTTVVVECCECKKKINPTELKLRAIYKDNGVICEDCAIIEAELFLKEEMNKLEDESVRLTVSSFKSICSK